MNANATIREFLATLKPGCNICSVAYVSHKTPGDGMLKKHRATGQPAEELYPQGVQREAVGRFLIGFDYEANVNQQRLREGAEADFAREPLWVSRAHPEGAGRHDAEFPQIVRHVDTGREYLYCRPHTDRSGKLRKEHSVWRDTATGRILTAEEVRDLYENLLPAISGNKKQDLKREVPVRVIAEDTLYAAKHGGGWVRFRLHDEL